MDWQEPQLAEPRPGYTGLPIESVPERSHRKRRRLENGGSAHSRSSSPGDRSGSEHGSVAPEGLDGAGKTDGLAEMSDSNGQSLSSPPTDTDNGDESPVHVKLRLNLKTGLTDNVREDSFTRRSSRPRAPVNYYGEDLDVSSNSRRTSRSRKSLDRKLDRQIDKMSEADDGPADATPAKPAQKSRSRRSRGGRAVKAEPAEATESTESAEAPAKPEVKQENGKDMRIRFSVPLNGRPEVKVEQVSRSGTPKLPPTPKQADNDGRGFTNNDYCGSCGRTGKLICCETCPTSMHFTCADPPLDENNLPDGAWHCKECQSRRHPPVPFKRSLFSALLNQLDQRNPKQFRLPHGLQTAFEGVVVGDDGAYVDENQLPSRRPRDPEESQRLEDKRGALITCFKCSKTALQGPIASCHKCQANWHVDCVSPPVTSIPARWVCPNHPEKATKIERRPKRPSYFESHLTRGAKNNGLIDVIDDDDEQLPVREIPYLNVRNTPTGVAAPIVRRRGARQVSLDGAIHRLPERSIKLDFIDYVHQEAAEPIKETPSQQYLLALDALATRPQPEREAARDLMYLKLEGPAVSYAEREENLERLVDAAIHASDEVQMAALKRIIKIKGKEQLLEFLMQP